MFKVIELGAPETAPCGRLLVEAGLDVTVGREARGTVGLTPAEVANLTERGAIR